MKKLSSSISLLLILLFTLSVSAQKLNFFDYYPIEEGNQWRYTAPPGWKDGDYISRIEKAKGDLAGPSCSNVFLHFDATNAAKIIDIPELSEEPIQYTGEVFADGAKVFFDKPVPWFQKKFAVGDSLQFETGFSRFIKGQKKEIRGKFRIRQKIVGFEDRVVTAGKFPKALRIDSDTYWDLGDGREAKSTNKYYYAKCIGVIEASARFIILKDGKEIINRLIETDLREYTVGSAKKCLGESPS